METKKTFTSYFMSFFAMAGIVIICAAMIVQRTENKKNIIQNNAEPYELKMSMRVLWEANTLHCRNLIISIINSLPEKPEAEKKLMITQAQLATTMKSCCGASVSELQSALEENVKTLSAIIEAVKINDAMKTEELKDTYRKNFLKVSDLLANTNASLSKNELLQSFENQLNLMVTCASLRKGNKYEQELDTFDKLHSEFLSLSDRLSEAFGKIPVVQKN